MGIEFAILDGIQLIRSPLGDWSMPLITRLGDGGVVWIALTLILLLIPKCRRLGLAMLLALVTEAVICNVLLKPMAARIRPFDVKQAVELLIKAPRDYSFPSGHTGASFAAAFSLLLMKDRRLVWPAMLLAILIAYSRLYLYVHYPTDVLAGVVLGLASAWCGKVVMQRIYKQKSA